MLQNGQDMFNHARRQAKKYPRKTQVVLLFTKSNTMFLKYFHPINDRGDLTDKSAKTKELDTGYGHIFEPTPFPALCKTVCYMTENKNNVRIA